MATSANYNLKSIRDQFRERGVFYTPLALAKKLADLLPKDITAVYDPTCGRGGLLAPFSESVELYGEDIDPEAIKDCKKLYPRGNFKVSDVLTNPSFIERKFPAIVANPPFSVKWEPKADPRWQDLPKLAPASKADWMFILHSIYQLEDNGTMVVIVAPGSLYRGQREASIRKYLAKLNYIDRIESIPAGQFTDTTIATNLLVIKKNRQPDELVTLVNDEHNLTKEVKPSVLVEEDNWQSLIPEPEIVLPPVDPIALNEEADKNMIKQLVTELKFARLVRQVDKNLPPLADLITNLRRAIDDFEREP